MRKILICSVAALAVLLAGGTALTKETNKAKEATKAEKNAAGKKVSERDKQWKEQLKAMTPEQKRQAMAQKQLDEELAPWLQVRKIAAEEKATKTVTAIDKIITAKKEQFKKRADAMKEKSAEAGKSKAQNTRPEGQRAERKKKAQTKE